jgi:hypothetical protein
MARANGEAFDHLHRILTEELIERISKGEECSTADIKAAIDWLAKNNITGVASGTSPLASLLASIELHEEEIESALR